MTKKEYIERYGEDAWKKRLEYNKQYMKQYNKKYYKDNKEDILEYHKQYYQDNKEHILEQSKQHYQDNKENILERVKIYRINNKENIAEYHKQYLNTPMGKAAKILSHCKGRDNARFGNNSCDLDTDWIINNIVNATHCHYCGCELNYDNLTIDRKNSDLPHTKDNCVASCFNCNRHKQDTPYEEYIAKLRETSNN